MAIFGKRHYEAIALAMQEAKRTALNAPDGNVGLTVGQWITCTEELADMFARDNGLFKRDRFERACEPGANVRARSCRVPPQGLPQDHTRSPRRF